jgi:RNA polymerase sigma-70 factor (ECF subfamily)
MAPPFPNPDQPVAPAQADDRAMARLAEGDADALQELFDRWKLPMLNFLYRAAGSYADAEDLTLEVFTEVWRQAARYQARGTFSAWLFTLARGKLRHEWRRRARRPVTAFSPDMPEPADPQSAPREVLEQEESLLNALQQLPDNQREALLLSVHSGLSSEAIADSLGIAPNHLYVLIHRARTALRAQLNPAAS